MKRFILFIFLYALSVISAEDQQRTDDLLSFEHQLYKTVVQNPLYSRYQRPVRNSSDVVNVKFGIALIKLLGVDEREQHMTSLMWIRQLWRDEYMGWEPSDYGGITVLRVPSSDLWRPDIKLYNGVGKQEFEESLAVLYHTGDVLHIPPATLVSTCGMDLRKFPFDEQTCALKFGSWTFDGNKVNFGFYEGHEGVDLSDHVGSMEWEVVSTSARHNQKFYPCCPEPYPDLTFNVTMRRRTTYYHYVFVTPAVMLALITPVLFLLPSDDTGKFPFGGTILVTIAVLYNLIEQQLPSGHNTIPVIGIYYTVVFVLIALSLAISAVTNNIANRATRISQPPNILKTVLLSCLGRLLCVPYDSNYGVGTSHVALDDGDGEKQESRQGKGPNDWRLIAMVLDRIFFLLFLIIVIITTLILLA